MSPNPALLTWPRMMSASAGTYYDEVMNDNPLAYWRLGESSGTTAEDSSGSNYDGTYYGSYALGEAGGVGDSDTAVLFDKYGGAGYGRVTIPDAAWMDQSSFTVEALFKTTTSGQVLYRDDGSSNRCFQLRVYGSTVGFIVWDSSATITLLEGGSSANDGNWHHLAATVNGATARLYLDGTEVDSASQGGGRSVAESLNISNGNIEAMDGWIDEAAFYSTALTATRIGAHATAAGL